MLDRIEHIVGQSNIMTDMLFGFTQARSTSDGILVCRILQTLCKRNNVPLLMGFIDLEKAYDRVHRPTLWKTLKRIVISAAVVKIIEQFNVGSQAKVQALGEVSTSFPLNNGVKQGSVISPCLYNIFMGAIITFAVNKMKIDGLGVKVMYQQNERLFEEIHIELAEMRQILAALFADDLVLFAQSSDHLQQMIKSFTDTANAFGQKVSSSKTEVMASTFGHLEQKAPKLEILLNQNGTVNILKQVKVFKYLGSRLTEDGEMDVEIGIRRNRMWEAYHKYAETIYLNPHIPLWNKLLLFTTSVIPQATYGCAAWIYEPKHLFQLEVTQLQILGKFMKPQGLKTLDMHTARGIAFRHHWKSLLPIA